MKIKRIRIFANNDIKSNKIKRELIDKLTENNYEIVTGNFDLGIAIGGDGSFLRMVKESKFNSNVFYIGVNTGTLGFAQEVNAEKIDDFIDKLNNDLYKQEKIGVVSVTVNHDGIIDNYHALNDVMLRDSLLNTTKLNIQIDGHELENFVGDGIIVSTSFGSTAYNLSLGGSVVYNTLHTLQITPIAPLNSKVYRNLLTSIVIPQNCRIKIKPFNDKKNLIVTVDGENIFYENVDSIEMIVDNKTIKCLRENNYNFIDKVNEKFLK